MSVGGGHLISTECEKERDTIARWRENIMDTVEIAVDLHDVGEIWLMSHWDCGACKKFGIVSNDTPNSDQCAVHRDMFRTSSKYLNNRFTGIVCRGFYLSNVDDMIVEM